MITLPDFSKIPKRVLLIVGVVAIVGLSYLVIQAFPRGEGGDEKADLAFWGPLPAEEASALIGPYETVQPGVKITYTQIPRDSYEKTLLNAMAAGRGPDMFLIRNRWLLKEIDKIAPASREQMNLLALRRLFPTAIEQDFTYNGQVFALPLYLDTLAMFYNKDRFDQAAIPEPPATWEEFQKIIPRLKSLSPTNQILKAAAAIGGSPKNVTYAVDLLNLLMMQNGAPMVNPDLSAVQFGSDEVPGSGLAAFEFYLQFANPGSPYYTWNENQESDIQSFTSGKTAVMFGYQETVKKIRDKSPFLKFDVAPMLQPSGGGVLNYPDYWGIAVSNRSPSQVSAWNFAVFAATNEGFARSYLASSGRPPALRSLTGGFANDLDLHVFAGQALTARSWLEIDDNEVEAAFSEAIRRAITGQADPGTALEEAAEKLNELMRREE